MRTFRWVTIVILLSGLSYAQESVAVLVLSARNGNATALRLLTALAQKGDVDSQGNLGVMYYSGDGVPKDLALAMFWLRKAADQGSAQAQLKLGHMYEA